jgi:hypothetical protein
MLAIPPHLYFQKKIKKKKINYNKTEKIRFFQCSCIYMTATRLVTMPFNQRQNGHCGNAAIIMRLLFLRMESLFLKNAWHFIDIFKEIATFVNISILFESICREIETFTFYLR